MIKINHIRLRSFTAAREFAADIPLTAGLNIIQADNTSGKSTCLQSIIYGLGLERSLGPRLDVPLPYAMRERIQVAKDGVYEAVLRSFVMLEVENSEGEVVTIRRDIAGGADKRLVQTWGSRLQDIEQAPNKRDYFLHDKGSASRSDGFHTFLAQFCGWALPDVPKFDGSECHLYLETLFPLFFVEQKRGWATTQGPLPTHFGIQDIARRVMEFVLALDAGESRRLRADLLKQRVQTEVRWKTLRLELLAEAGDTVRVRGLADSPNAEFLHTQDISLSVYHDNEWSSLDTVARLMAQRAEALEAMPPPIADAASNHLREQLAEAEQRYTELSSAIALLRHEHGTLLTEKHSIEQRVDSLKLDLDRNRDAKKLQALGSTIGTAASNHSCPTCHQSVTKELLPETSANAMGLDENIAFIRSQLELYASMSASTDADLNTIVVRYKSLEDELSEIRSRIRSIKDDLVRPAGTPIRSEIEELVRIQSRLSKWATLKERIDAASDGLRSIASTWVELTEQLRALGSGSLTENDREKVASVQSNMQALLRNFGFESFKPEEITLSEDVFRPQVMTRDDDGEFIEKDIGFEASASDGIRLKWAYYLSLLAVSMTRPTNHAGMVVFDEPGQQQMKEIDLSRLLDWASKNIGPDRQMIVSTSEKLDQVQQSVAAGTATIRSFNGFILKPAPKRHP